MQSRSEEILKSIVGEEPYELKPPQSRIEVLLYELKELIESGGDISAINEIKSEISKITIKKSTSGSSITLTDSADYKVQELKVYGKSVQSGTPTPSTPAEITSVVNPKVSVSGKNLVNYTDAEDTAPTPISLTFSNGHITGTTTTQYARISYKLNKPKAESLTFSISGGNSTCTSELRVYKLVNNSYGDLVVNKTFQYSTKGEVTFTPNGTDDYVIWFRPNSAVSFDYYDIQLEQGTQTTSYEPYKSNSQTYSYTLRSIGDIKDELIVYADGSGKLVKRIGDVDLGSLNWVQQNGGNLSRYYAEDSKVANGKDYAIMCGTYRQIKQAEWGAYSDGIATRVTADTLHRIMICDNSILGDTNALKSSLNGVVAFYELATPTETTISAETVKTYYPTSIVSVDQSTMDIEYVADTKTYVDSIGAPVIDSTLSTTSTNPVQNKVITAEINDLKNSVSNGKTLVANAITDKGVATDPSDTFQTMADNIADIQSGGGVEYTFDCSDKKESFSSIADLNTSLDIQKIIYKLAGAEADTGCEIYTGVKANDTIRILFKGRIHGSTGASFIGGTSTPEQMLRLFAYGDNFYLDYGYESNRCISSAYIDYKDVYTLEIGNSYIKDIDSSAIIAQSSKTGTFSYDDVSIKIFGPNERGIIYWLKIYDGEILVRDYVVQEDSDGIYFYDKVQRKKYYNEGTGQFNGIYDYAPE